MKNFRSITILAALAAALTPLSLLAANPPAGYIDFGKLNPGPSGGQFVEVNVNSNLIAMAAKLTQRAEPEVADLLQGLHSIRVNIVGLNDENRAEMESRIKNIRTQLETQSWERIVTAQENNQDVSVYLKTRGQDAVEGIVVTVLEGQKQAVLINVVGNIKPEKLGMLGEKFNIDPLKKMGRAKHHHEAAEKE
jgi:hypothetical protein